MKHKKIIIHCRLRVIAVACLVLFGTLNNFFTLAAAADFIQVPGVIHVHSAFSSGDYTLEELVARAKEKGIEVLIPTDHDLVAMEYGVFPLRNIIKKRVEQKSIIRMGPEKYLDAIKQINDKQKDVIIIPGVQSSPFYYWTGNPLEGNLTAHNYRKEMLIIGMNDPADYRNLPLMHRGFSTDHIVTYIPQLIIFFISLLLSVYLYFQRRNYRLFGMGIGALSILLLINHHPFQSSKYDPHYGDQGIKPYQDLIDYVGNRNGLTFWAHPEAKYAQQGVKMGPVTLQTQPYPDALVESIDYTGFSGLYGEYTTADDPGQQWDQALLDYCEGKREQPVWIIAGADFHKDRNAGGAIDFDSYQTIFLVQKKSANAILDALSTGIVYAARKGNKGRLTLDLFQIGSKGSKVYANMGQKLNNPSVTEINIRITASDQGQHPIKMTLIRGSRIIEELEGNTPFDFKMEDEDSWTGITYYRLEVDGGGALGTILSNPIFVSKR